MSQLLSENNGRDKVNSTFISLTAIQHESIPYKSRLYLESVETLLGKTGIKHGSLVALPELFATGYIPNKNIFSLGENEDGATITWMKRLA